MQQWIQWWNVAAQLRPKCTRTRTFLWLIVAFAGISVRSDLLGVTSVVRSLGLNEKFYDRLLDLFHSRAIDPDRLSQVWTQIVLRIFPSALRLNGRLVLLGDGIKIPKSGRKMPAVKTLHQESDSNTKPEYIMGHSCQTVSIVVGALESAFAVSLATRIHEGLVFSNRDERTLPRKMVSLIKMLGITEPFYFVADAPYAARVVALGLLADRRHSTLWNQDRTLIQSSPSSCWRICMPLLDTRNEAKKTFFRRPVSL